MHDVGNGDNTVTNTGSIISGSVFAGSGDDTLTNDGSIISTNVDLGDGDNTLTNVNGSIISGSVTTGSGDDTINNLDTSSIGAGVDMGDGNNSLTNEGSITGNVSSTGTLTVDSGTVLATELVGRYDGGQQERGRGTSRSAQATTRSRIPARSAAQSTWAPEPTCSTQAALFPGWHPDGDAAGSAPSTPAWRRTIGTVTTSMRDEHQWRHEHLNAWLSTDRHARPTVNVTRAGSVPNADFSAPTPW
jgi:hypothetical protein